MLICMSRFTRRIFTHRPQGKVSKILRTLRRTSVMRNQSHMLRSKAERQGGGERFQSLHLAIKPFLGVFAIPVCPAHSSPQIFYAESLQPFHSQVKTMVLVMEPLANTKPIRKTLSRLFGRAILAEQAHVIVAIISAAFSFLVPRGSTPCCGKVQQAVPVNTVNNRQQQFSRLLDAESLDFFRAKRRKIGRAS